MEATESPAAQVGDHVDYITHDVRVAATTHGVREIRRIVGPCIELSAQAEAAVEALGHAGVLGADALIAAATTIAARAYTSSRLYDRSAATGCVDNRSRYFAKAARLRQIASDLHGYVHKLQGATLAEVLA